MVSPDTVEQWWNWCRSQCLGKDSSLWHKWSWWFTFSLFSFVDNSRAEEQGEPPESKHTNDSGDESKESVDNQATLWVHGGLKDNETYKFDLADSYCPACHYSEAWVSNGKKQSTLGLNICLSLICFNFIFLKFSGTQSLESGWKLLTEKRVMKW